jgi:potassium/chloride transporter 4/5/6
VAQVVITGGAVDRNTALTNNLIVTDVGWPVPHIIFAGIMLSTLGAGLQSLAGAPRLLAAIAHDDLIPILRPLVPPVRLRRISPIESALAQRCCLPTAV